VHFFLCLEPKVFDLFGSYCVFVPKVLIRAFWKRSEPLGLGLVVPFVPKVFWFGPFERSKPLGVWFALVVPFGAEGFLVRTF